MRTIIRVSPKGYLTAHQAGTKPFPDYKERWQKLMIIKDRKNRPLTWITKHAYPLLVNLYNL